MTKTQSNYATASSTKADGSMKLADGTVDLVNIKKFLTSQNLPTDTVCMEQVHGGAVGIVHNADKEIHKAVDGLVTNVKGISLCVVTADCLPILLYDPENKAIGVIHAGYKGLLQNIIHSTVSAMSFQFDSKSKNIQVSIGPAIEESCYEVGKEVIEQFESFHDPESLYSQRDEKYFLSIQKTALQCLEKEGILKEQITVSDQCTKCSIDTLYSYRRGDKTDRFVSVITLL